MTNERTLQEFFDSVKHKYRKGKLENILELGMFLVLAKECEDSHLNMTAKTLRGFVDNQIDLSVSEKGWLLELMAGTIASVHQEKENSIFNRFLGIGKEK